MIQNNNQSLTTNSLSHVQDSVTTEVVDSVTQDDTTPSSSQQDNNQLHKEEIESHYSDGEENDMKDQQAER